MILTNNQFLKIFKKYHSLYHFNDLKNIFFILLILHFYQVKIKQSNDAFISCHFFLVKLSFNLNSV